MVRPSARLRSTYSRVVGSWIMRVIVAMCRARVQPPVSTAVEAMANGVSDEAGLGLTPARQANAPSSSTESQSPPISKRSAEAGNLSPTPKHSPAQSRPSAGPGAHHRLRTRWPAISRGPYSPTPRPNSAGLSRSAPTT